MKPEAMTPEEIHDLEEQAAKGNPEACVKLSFHLMATDSSNPENVKRAGLLNQKAVEQFKNRLVRCIARSTFEAADIEAESKMYLGLLYETGPVGIKRDPVTAFYLIQDSIGIRGGFEENPFWRKLKEFSVIAGSCSQGIHSDETEAWKQAASLLERLDKLNHKNSLIKSLRIIDSSELDSAELDSAELDSVINNCIASLNGGHLDGSQSGEFLYIKSCARFLQLGIQQCKKFKASNQTGYLSGVDLIDFLKHELHGAVLCSDNSLIFEVKPHDEHHQVCLVYNEILSDLEKAVGFKNGKATMEVARVWDHLADSFSDDNPNAKSIAFAKARDHYAKLVELGCADAMYHLGDMIRCFTKDESGLGFRYFKQGADMLGPTKTESVYLPETIRHSHIGDQFAADPTLDLAERWKFFETAEDPSGFLDDDEVFWSASRAARAEALLRFKTWNKATEFISRLRRNKPLSSRFETADGFSPIETIVFNKQLCLTNSSDLEGFNFDIL
jgi:hypothetical protein